MCFFFALERESVSPALDLPACVYERFLPIHLHPMPVLYPPPPLWTSFSPPQLPSFSSQLAPFSLVTARALNFHDCCLFLARSSFLLLPLPSSFLPSSFPIPSLVTWCLSPSLLLSHFSSLPVSLISLHFHSRSSLPSFPSFFLHPALLCLPSSECCWRRA